MRNYAKVGGQQGKPGYRTPSSFINRKKIASDKEKADKADKLPSLWRKHSKKGF